jgi:hypothetical protein
VEIVDNINLVTIYSSDDQKILSFVDFQMDPNNLSTFRRKLNTETLYFVDGEKKFSKIQKDCKFISKLNDQKISKIKVITMDLETRVINREMSPVSISIHDGENQKSFTI